MAIVRTLRTIKFAGSGQDAELTSVDLEYTDDASGAYATGGQISLSGTPNADGIFRIGYFSDIDFHFSHTDSLTVIHEKIKDLINSQSSVFSATSDASGVYLTALFKGAGLNVSDFELSMVTASGLSISAVAPSGGIDPTPTGQLNLMFDGSHSKINIHSSYDSDVINDRAYFVGKMRSEISLPAVQETVETCDANGDVIETILFF